MTNPNTITHFGNGINYNGGFSTDMFDAADAGKESVVCKRAGAFTVVMLGNDIPGAGGYLVIPKGYRVFADNNTELTIGRNCYEVLHYVRIGEDWYRKE